MNSEDPVPPPEEHRNERQPPPADVTVRRRRAGATSGWGWLLVLAALGAAGWYGHQAWRQWTDETARRHATLARLENELQTLRRQTEQLQARHAELTGSVGELGDAISGGRTQIQLAAVEQLLLLANDRLLLARDVDGARRALQTADERLAALKDPRLLPVREALAAEQAALAALPEADTAGIALTLAQIARDAPRFALRARVPERFEAAPQDTVPPPDANAGQRVWAAVKTALAAIFTLRRSEGPPLRLLAPAEEELALRILQLKLEGARIALLAGDGAAMRDLARGTADWLRTYYNESGGGVRAALTELDRIAQLQLSPAPPDIGRSLKLLREQLTQPAA